MVVLMACEMQGAVDDEMGEMGPRRPVFTPRLAYNCAQGQHDLARQVWPRRLIR